MGERAIYRLDLLDPERREVWERAARRNGEKLAAMVRRVVDADVERRPAALVPTWKRPVSFQIDPADECRHVVFRVKQLPWGGRQCEGCGDLL